jgi:hypothetical protein
VNVKVREVRSFVPSASVVTIEHNHFMLKNAHAPIRIVKERSASARRFEHHAVCAAKPETLGNLRLQREQIFHFYLKLLIHLHTRIFCRS